MTRASFRLADLDDEEFDLDAIDDDEEDDEDDDEEETGDDNDPDPEADFQGLMA